MDMKHTHTLLIAAVILLPVMLSAQGGGQRSIHESGRIDIPPRGDSAAENARGLAGAPAPPFMVRSLDDTARYIGNMEFDGEVFLVDFWATWCPPCVDALPELEKIYKEFHPRGFDILSLSFDSSDERVRIFREKHFAMPWKHGRLEDGFNDVVSLSFGLENIPHYVLVGRDARVIAEGDWIHGEKLRELLEGYLGD